MHPSFTKRSVIINDIPSSRHREDGKKQEKMNQNRFDEEQYKKIEIRKSAKKAEYRNKKHKKRRERYGR